MIYFVFFFIEVVDKPKLLDDSLRIFFREVVGKPKLLDDSFRIFFFIEVLGKPKPLK